MKKDFGAKLNEEGRFGNVVSDRKKRCFSFFGYFFFFLIAKKEKKVTKQLTRIIYNKAL